MKNISYENRQLLEKRLSENIPISKIADEIGVNRITIYNELKRCEEGKYSADEAQKTVKVIRSYKKITYEDRVIIENELKNNTPISKIADEIGVHRVTIYNELKRCEEGKYSADIAQKGVWCYICTNDAVKFLMYRYSGK